jgi:hypothetical protein
VSQKFTCPADTTADPARTVAVKVTTAPCATDAADDPAEVTAKAVEVVTGVALIPTTRGAVATSAPEVPVIVAILDPALAELLAVTVIRLEDPGIAGFGENVALTPLGSPVASRLTLPLNPC